MSKKKKKSRRRKPYVQKYNETDFRALDIEYKHAKSCLEILWGLSNRQIDGLMKGQITRSIRQILGQVVSHDDLMAAKEEQAIKEELLEDLEIAFEDDLLVKLEKASKRAKKKQRRS